MGEKPFGRKFQGKRFTGTLEEYLLERSAVDPVTGCRNWLMSTAGAGYGYFLWQGKWIYAHRAGYQVWVGDIPNDMQVLHRCDNPPCFNPEHLFLGTQKQNIRDMIQKGRGFRQRARTRLLEANQDAVGN